ncbi:RNA-directed DNA polymerase, eukaryota, partial [Tanacetum coccineum]
LSLLHDLISSTLLSNVEDRWVWNLNGSGLFRVSDIRNLVDETFLPKDEVATRWIKYIPIKINIFAWKVRLDRLPTRLNLVHRGVQVTSLACPVCSTSHENTSHILFSCSMASDIARLISRWWDLGWSPLGSYAEWLSWFKDIRMGSKLKSMLEGVFFVSWWCIWNYRNQLLFASRKPRKNVIFDDIVLALVVLLFLPVFVPLFGFVELGDPLVKFSISSKVSVLDLLALLLAVRFRSLPLGGSVAVLTFSSLALSSLGFDSLAHLQSIIVWVGLCFCSAGGVVGKVLGQLQVPHLGLSFVCWLLVLVTSSWFISLSPVELRCSWFCLEQVIASGVICYVASLLL